MIADFEDGWAAYRKIKARLLWLLLGWIPFGFIIGYILPEISGTFVPTYLAAGLYGIALMISWLQYVLYSCPHCGTVLRGTQFFLRRCRVCGEPINPSLNGHDPKQTSG